MLGVLLALLGGMLGLAGAGGGSSAKTPPVVPGDTVSDPGDSVSIPVTDDVVPPTIDDDTPSPVKPDPIDPAPAPGDGHGGGMDDGHGTGGHGGGVDDGHGTGGNGGGVGDGHGTGGNGGGVGDGHGTGGNGGGVGDGHGTGGHGGGDAHLPTTPAEIEAFVAQVRAAPEIHVHSHGDGKMAEHSALMDLVPPSEATHIAIGNGSWFDPSNWHNGEIPGSSAKVLIPDGVSMDYDDVSDARLFTLRVNGELNFATDTDSKMVVDTFVVAPNGTLTAGTEADPVENGVNVDIVIANNGDIDTDWDPTLISRGLISHGEVKIHGMQKDSHDKVSEDPMAGDTSITFDALPEGWQVGDKIVIAGTHYDGYAYNNAAKKTVYNEPEDEIRFISKIEGNEVFFNKPLEHDHDTPRADLHTSVANYSRSVTVRSEDGDDSELFERGHVMFMHSDDVDVRYAAFDALGRTDKSKLSQEASDFDDIASDSNVTGRYALHLHRLGTSDADDPAIMHGNAVFGSPGWGIVHHDSNAILENNATYDTFGAGFVSETGNEIGAWIDNIAIDAQGRSWGHSKVQIKDLEEFDTAVSGDGFWFQSRMVESADNVAASVNHGFVYFHRGPIAEFNGGDGNITFDATDFAFPEAFYYDDDIRPGKVPILEFSGNETFAAKEGLQVVKANPNQRHDIHSVLEDFTAWNVQSGVHLEYTSHYLLKDFDLIARDGKVKDGIDLGSNTTDIVIEGGSIEGFKIGVDLNKNLVGESVGDKGHGFIVIGTDLMGNSSDYDDYDPVIDLVIEDEKAVDWDAEVSLELRELVFVHNEKMYVGGTKTDSLGESKFPAGTDSIRLDSADVSRLLESSGYFTDENGDNYFLFDIYFSDRLTGDIYKQAEMVRLDDSVNLKQVNGPYDDALFNGKTTLADLKAATGEAELVLDYSERTALIHQDVLQDDHDHTDHAHADMETQGAHQHQTATLWDALTFGHGIYPDEMENGDDIREHEADLAHTL